MMCHDDLWHGRHTHGISTEEVVHLILGRSLEGGTLNADIHPVGDTDTLLLGDVGSQLDELAVIGLVHIGEAGTRGEILATERMLREEIDMVGDNHQVADLERRVHAPCRIRHEECLDAQFIHHPDREGHLLHRVALIEVETPLHRHDVDTPQLAENEFSAMSLDGRDGEVGNLLIGNLVCVSYFGS